MLKALVVFSLCCKSLGKSPSAFLGDPSQGFSGTASSGKGEVMLHSSAEPGCPVVPFMAGLPG